MDTFWLDIDYMDNKFIFTTDEKHFKASDLNALKRKYNKKMVPIIDPSVAAYPYIKTTNARYEPLING